MILWLLLIGAFRIIQANCNKQTSSYLTSAKDSFKFGVYFEFAAAVFSFLYLCLVGFHGVHGMAVVCCILTAFFYATELITNLESLKGAPLVLCNMCAMGGGIILTSIIGIFFFDEPMSVIQWLGVAMFFAATYCLSPGAKADKSAGTKKLSGKTLLVLALNFVINGGASIMSKYYAVKVENPNPAFYSFGTYLCSSLLFLILFAVLSIRKRENIPGSAEQPVKKEGFLPKKLWIYGAILGANCASLVYWVTYLSKSITVVVLNTVPSAISIIACLFIGALVFKEKITVKNVIGVILGILSVVMLVVS